MTPTSKTLTEEEVDNIAGGLIAMTSIRCTESGQGFLHLLRESFLGMSATLISMDYGEADTDAVMGKAMAKIQTAEKAAEHLLAKARRRAAESN